MDQNVDANREQLLWIPEISAFNNSSFLTLSHPFVVT